MVQVTLEKFPEGVHNDFVGRGWPAEKAPPGTVMKRLNVQRECFDSKVDIGVYDKTTAGGMARKRDSREVPQELADKGVTQDAWERFVFEDLNEAMGVLHHCCFETWCCLFTCCLSKIVCEKPNRKQFHEAGRAWEDDFNKYLEPLGCYAKVLSYGYQSMNASVSNGQAQPPGDGVSHGLVIAFTPETVQVLKDRPRATGFKSKKYSKPTDFVMLT